MKVEKLLKEIREEQKELDRRTQVENEAIKLISQCRFDEACALLDKI